VAKAIRKHRKALWEFLEGKSPQTQSCQGFSLWEIEAIPVEGGAVVSNPFPSRSLPPCNIAAFGTQKAQNSILGNFLGVKALKVKPCIGFALWEIEAIPVEGGAVVSNPFPSRSLLPRNIAGFGTQKAQKSAVANFWG
jgi:hypothetical protein